MKTRRRYPHAQFHLPPLDADLALMLVNLLDHAIAAIWRAHGPSMADRLSELRNPTIASQTQNATDEDLDDPVF